MAFKAPPRNAADSFAPAESAVDTSVVNGRPPSQKRQTKRKMARKTVHRDESAGSGNGAVAEAMPAAPGGGGSKSKRVRVAIYLSFVFVVCLTLILKLSGVRYFQHIPQIF
jgi:hypothetical protein